MPKSISELSCLCVLLLALLFTISARAETQDEAFEARVRAYLLANPEVILEALEVLSQREAKATLAAKIGGHENLFTDAPTLGIGPLTGPLRVVEFFDYRCAPCKAMHPKLKAALSDHPNIRVEMRHLPILSPGSERGARFALAVKETTSPKTYAAVHDRLWALRGPLNTQAFRQIAKDLDLDWNKINEVMNSQNVSDRIGKNRDIAIDLQILGTPAFVSPNSVSFGDTDAKALVQVWLNADP